MDIKSSIFLLVTVVLLAGGVWFWLQNIDSNVDSLEEVQVWFTHPDLNFSFQVPPEWSSGDYRVRESAINGRRTLAFDFLATESGVEPVFKIDINLADSDLLLDERAGDVILAETSDLVFVWRPADTNPFSGSDKERYQQMVDQSVLIKETFVLEDVN